MERNTLIGIVAGSVVLGFAVGAGTMQALNKKKFGAGSDALTCSAGGGTSSIAPLFAFNGKNYTQADLPLEVQGNITRLQSQTYQQLSTYLTEVAVRLALAKEKNVAGDNLPQVTDLLDGVKVSDQEVNAIIEAQKNNLPKGVSMDEIRKQVTSFLQRQRGQQVVMQKVKDMETSGAFKLLLEQPAGRPLETAGYPFKGKEGAAVQVAVITDFLCAHCRNQSPEIEQVKVDYADRIQLHQMVFSLNAEGLSGVLATGAYCANKINPELYWKYHAGAEKVPLEAARSVSPDAQKEFKNHALGVAKEAGLDVQAFEKCLASKDAQDFVQKGNAMMTAAGVDGTPAYFINGKRVLVSPGSFGEKIKEALATATK